MMNKNFDFERSWQEKIETAVSSVIGESAARMVLAGSETLSDTADRNEVFAWTGEAMRRLSHAADKEEQIEIMTSCSCRYPTADLDEIREAYRQKGDLRIAHEMLQAKFESFLSENLDVPETLKKEIKARSWGLAGVLDGNRVVATKIPKSGYLEEYFSEPDPAKKRALYCHCPRIREAFSLGIPMPTVYCYCGAGFYKGIWEDITGKKVKVKILSSVLAGDDVCSFEILL
jgi:hypothetical protein